MSDWYRYGDTNQTSIMAGRAAARRGVAMPVAVISGSGGDRGRAA
jgi:hypothetical protein